MNYKQFVIDNQGLLQELRDRTPGNDYVDKLYSSLDLACSRFHTILLNLSNQPLKADEYSADVLACKKAIDDFYKYTQRYRFSDFMTRWIYKIILHGIGTRRIPKIRKLLFEIQDDH